MGANGGGVTSALNVHSFVVYSEEKAVSRPAELGRR